MVACQEPSAEPVISPEPNPPVAVLTIDGGGMRGLYAATALRTLAQRFAAHFQLPELDVGKGFDVIVGTSTGGILAASLAAGIPLREVQSFYRRVGPKLFRDPVPRSSGKISRSLKLSRWLLRNLRHAANENSALRQALAEIFLNETMAQLYDRRQIGLCLTGTSFIHHLPRVFKTPHRELYDRDAAIKLTDACLATSAAPLYLPLVSIQNNESGKEILADGGLWANNPIVIGLLEGLALSEPDQPLIIVSVGTCPPAPGSLPLDQNLGVLGWQGGVQILELAMRAQAVSAIHAADLLTEQLSRLNKKVEIVRTASSFPSAEQAELLHLDSTSETALELMFTLGETDGNATYRWYQKATTRGLALGKIFSRMKTP